MGLMWTGAIVGGLVVGLFVMEMTRMGFIAVLAGLAPTGLLVWSLIKRAGGREAAHQSMLQAAGVAQGAGFDHSEEGTGIAINKQGKTLSLLMGGFHKTYPYADIREWQSIKETAGAAVGVGVSGGLAAMGASERMKRDAAANTGFFVTVRDVDNPKWRIEMKDEATQARWMELLRQEINER